MAIQTQVINPRPRFTKYLLEKEIFSAYPMSVIDVGARGGFEKQWYIYGSQGRRIGFESSIEECDSLNSVKTDPHTQYYPIALHRRRGFKTFNVQQHIASSSFYKSDQGFVSRFPGWKDLIPNKTERLATTDLDSFVKRELISQIDFIKLDIEGAELEVFKGAKKTLQGSLGISTEAVFYPWRKGMPTFTDIDLFLRKFGFILFDLPIFHWTRKTLSPLMFTDGVLGPSERGQAIWTQAIYLRDAVRELESAKLPKKWNVIKILKLASIMELYQLEDCPIELLIMAETKKILEGCNVAYLIDLFTPPLNGQDVTYAEYVAYIKKEGPPRYIEGRRVSQEEYNRWIKNRK